MTVGLVVATVIAAPVMAASWSETPIAAGEGELSTPVGVAGGLVTLSGDRAVVLYADLTDTDTGIAYANLAVRRTTDSGVTWKPPIVLSTATVSDMAIAGRGSHVDAIWVDGADDADTSRVLLARSSDAGASFASAQVISSPAVGFPLDVSVARGPGSTVVVAWTTRQGSWSIVRVRVSTDGGSTFGPPSTLGTGLVRDVKVAVGNGTIYAIFVKRESGARNLYLRRSGSFGTDWSAARKLGRNISGSGFTLEVQPEPLITAEGDEAYVGLMSDIPDSRTRLYYRHTVDGGDNWTPTKRLTGPLDLNPQAALVLQGGVARAGFARCGNPECDWQTIQYKQSSDGVVWSASEQVSWTDLQPWVAGVGFAGKTMVLTTDVPDGSDGPFGAYMYVRTP
jgi:hypothetical protein